jgi:hypothetical protein
MSNFCGGGDITKIYIVGAGGTGSTTNTDIYVTGFTYDNGILTISQNGGQPNLSVILPTFITGNTDYYVTGGTYSNGVLTLNRQNGSLTITGFTTTFTGNTSGDCITDLFVSNVNSCSPLHIQPINNGDVYISESGGNVGVGTTNPLSTLDVNGKITTTNFQMTSGSTYGYVLTSDVSGNAYWAPPFSGTSVDTYVTGFTYSNNNFVISQNQGQTNLSVNISTITGLTSTGNIYYSFGSGWTQNQTVDYISAATGNILVTKEWVESLSADLSSSIAVNVATTTALPASTYNNGVNGVGATLTRNTNGTTGTIDGITVGLGDRILVKNQASQIQNGVYGVTVLGTGSTAFVLTRTTDSDTTVEFDPQIVIASRGTQAGLRFAQTTSDPIVGTSNIVYTNVGSSFVTQSAAGTQTSGNIPFWTNVARDLSKGSNTQLFWDNVNKRLGVGIGSPTASLHIKGSGTTNATYSLKVQDSLNRNILSTRNDNFVVVGDAAVNSYLWVSGPSGQFGFTNESGNPYLYLNSNITNNKFFISNGGAGSNVFGQINTNNGNWLFSDPNSNANLAILTDTKVTINGADSSSTKYGLRVTQNNDPGLTNVTTDVFVVRNDSKVGVGTSNPTEKFEVSGKTKTITLQVTSGATTGYVLTALDSNGNAYWAPSFSGGSSSSVDTFVTGFTYSNNNLTILQNQGQLPLTVNISSMTGLTINGGLTATTITSTDLSGNGDRIVIASSVGTLSASSQSIIQTYIDPTGTVAGYLDNTSNWDINGIYTGPTISGTYQGQKHYNLNYFFEAVDDNLWIRLIRG